MTYEIVKGDARKLDLDDASVDLIVTSPPYWALRSYRDGGEHYADQLGAEPTPTAYVDNLIECAREWVRVLKPSGSLWINLGDKYAGSDGTSGGKNGTVGGGQKRNALDGGIRKRPATGAPTKSLIGLPWRFALRCIDDLGLILRAEVIWSKPNGLPESVTDRVRRSHEQWFHFVKSPRYFSAVDTIREAHDERYAQRRLTPAPLKAKGNNDRNDGWSGVLRTEKAVTGNPLGKLPGSVWTIATQPLKVPAELGIDHFAAFPMEWPRRIILGWSPSGICVQCGEGRRPVHDGSEKRLHRPSGADRVGDWNWDHEDQGRRRDRIGNVRTVHRITGEQCACPDTSAETRPAIVLDPFGGTGTTALVADVLGRHGISVDLSEDYCRLAEWRINDPKQRERAMRKSVTSGR